MTEMKKKYFISYCMQMKPIQNRNQKGIQGYESTLQTPFLSWFPAIRVHNKGL